ncbi:type VII secretion protein EccB [Paractinoplanes brasiliensis]|uniref:Type VII secretion protein EccB n=1 Tax=Paractinoplanes brasiliensis TaxID=52695 RepID=A0A4R6JER5_9ACTN|nr:type VII secretion protein EccB [Actinoplanes brasiliensis]TDO33086.1 type VII secretion protein EccB [Actinoplanes brasiliensis]GID28805.1 type VII secretion protein EccB [Actinoplanes brasiliensis]
MQTQRDHVHAHTFMMGRLSSALVEGDPTGAEIPGRRAQTGLLVGLILLLLLVGGFAVYGWIVPGGSKAYRQAGAILVEKETGNRYVYLDGALHQTPDLTSAMLIQGAAGKVKLISRNSIKDVPRGIPLGVAGAPQQMPAADALAKGPWLACLPGSVVPGKRVSGLGVNLEPQTPATPLAEGAFLVVRDPGGVAYLLANYLKYRIDDDAVLVALGAAAINPPTAPAIWLGWLGDGPALAPATIPGAGSAGPRVGGRPYAVGTLFRQGADQHFVLRRDGLAPMSRTEFLIADAKTPGPPVTLDPADVVGARRSADRTLLNRLPDLASLRLADPSGQAVCMQQRPISPETISSIVVLTPAWAAGVWSDGRTTVLAEPGSGMAVLPVPLESRVTAKKITFISDEGVTYRLADQTTVASLKLAGATPVPFPKELLATLPQGPVLSRAAVTSLARG